MIDGPDPGEPAPPQASSTPERPQSYAEKYAGTPWGRPSAPAPPPPPARSRTPLAFVAVAVVAIVIAGAGLVYLAVSPSQTDPKPLPSGLADSVPSLRAGVATPTPTPTPDPGQAIKDKFWALVSAPDFSYRRSASGKTLFDRKTYETFVESFTVVGDDYTGKTKSSARGPLLAGVQPTRIRSAQVARKDGTVYLKEAGKHRTALRSNDRRDRLAPFLYLDVPGMFDYVKPVTVGGRHLHLLRSNKFYRPDIARMLDLRRFAGVPDDQSVDVYVTSDGVPVSAVYTLGLVAYDQYNKRHTFTGRTAFTFKNVGDKLAIRIPKR